MSDETHRPSSSAWWKSLKREGLDDAFLDTLRVLHEAFLRTPGPARDQARSRRDRYRAAARLAPEGGIARQRLERKAAVIDHLLHSPPPPLPATPGDPPTPETSVRRRTASPLVGLQASGHLDDAEILAALRVRRVIEGITRPVMARITRFDALPGAAAAAGAGRALDLLPTELALEHSRLYLPWTHDVAAWTRKPPYRPLALVLDIVVHDVGVDTARRRHHCAAPTALRDLKDALALYARRAGIGRHRSPQKTA